MPEHRKQFTFKGKREHIAQVNIPNNISKPTHSNNNNEISHGLRDQVILPDTVKIMFILAIQSTDKKRSIVENVDRALVKKRC